MTVIFSVRYTDIRITAPDALCGKLFVRGRRVRACCYGSRREIMSLIFFEISVPCDFTRQKGK